MKERKWLGLALLLALAVTGCSEKSWRSRNKVDEYDNVMAAGKAKVLKDGEKTGDYDSMADAGEESVFTLGDGGGVFGSSRTLSKEDIRARKLFGGALSVVMDLPVVVASETGGFVSTDWKTDPANPGVRYRLNIRVSGQEPYGAVEVRVLKQEAERGGWADRPPETRLARQIEKAIRKRAGEELAQ
ncbi:MAG: DUF3576 domain-containing protein [Magnetococcales bacterium]|nr:DUF3576 domain-containing protein [Magnetococcales bacterium]